MNLFDTGPGRTEKMFALLATGLCVGAWTTYPLELLGPFVAPVALGFAYTVRERAMLGDTGSNPARGARWYLAADHAGRRDARLVALAVVVAITAYGEFRSLGDLIERVPALRSLDRIGRLRGAEKSTSARQADVRRRRRSIGVEGHRACATNPGSEGRHALTSADAGGAVARRRHSRGRAGRALRRADHAAGFTSSRVGCRRARLRPASAELPAQQRAVRSRGRLQRSWLGLHALSGADGGDAPAGGAR